MNGPLLLNASAPGPGGQAGPAPRGSKTFQAYLTGAAAVAATIKIEVSNLHPDQVASSWVTAMTFTMSGTVVTTEAQKLDVPYAYWRANLVAITGTSALASVWVNL